jgi:hypothetical protein
MTRKRAPAQDRCANIAAQTGALDVVHRNNREGAIVPRAQAASVRAPSANL